MKLTLSILGILMLALAACSGGATASKQAHSARAPTTASQATQPAPDTGTAVATATRVPDPASAAAAQSALLELSDFPAGWTSAAQNHSTDPNISFTGECAQYNNDTMPGDLADKESEDFTGPHDQVLSSTASAFDTEASATAAYGAVGDLPQRCLRQLENSIAQVMHDSAVSGGADPSLSAQVHADTMPFMKLGDGSIAYRFQWSVRTTVALYGTIDYITWRRGRMVGGIIYTAFGSFDPSAEEAALAQIIDGRLARANATLAQ